MCKVDLVVFDMAGTTVDEDNVVYRTVHESIVNAGYDDVALEEVLLHGAGKEKHQAIKDVIASKGIEGADTEAIFSNFKESLDAAYDALIVRTFKGMNRLIARLREKHVKIALDTGYNFRIAKLLLTKLGWKEGQQYDTLVTADDVVNGRPNPDMIELAMKRLGVTDASRVLKAGDSAIDIEEGKNAGCGITVGVTTGAQTREQLAEAEPTLILDSLVDVLDHI